MAYASVPQIDWLVWAAAASWVSAMHVLGSLRPIMRAAVEAVLPTLNASSQRSGETWPVRPG